MGLFNGKLPLPFALLVLSLKFVFLRLVMWSVALYTLFANPFVGFIAESN